MRTPTSIILASIFIANTIFADSNVLSPLSASSSQDRHLQIIARGPNGLSLSADLSDITISSTNSNDLPIDLEGEGRIGLPGYPDLPAITRLFVIPPTGSCEVSFSASDPNLISDTPFLIFPAIDGEGNQQITPSQSFLSTNSFWPEQLVQLDEPVIMRGVRMVRMTIYPVQVNPVTGAVRSYDNIDVELKFNNSFGQNPVINPDRPRPSGTALKMIRSIVANPELIRDQVVQKGAFVYVIPNYNGVAAAIQPLVELRRLQGYPTEIITVAANASNVDVKDALQDAYDNWEIPPEIICIIGEADLQSADFMIATWDVGRAYMWETDYKYGLLEGNDLLPEAAVGRLSVRSLNELRTIVAKVTGYELNPPLDDTTWFTKGAVMANDPRTGYSSIYLQRWARKLLIEVGFAEVDTFFFIHQNQESDHDFVRRTVNEGISVFNYRGWGQFNGAWVVGDVGELRNDRKLPLMILPTCNTCDFADHILSPHSYAEDFLWAQNGGAIGTIGSSGFTHTNYNNVLDGGILNSFYRDGIFPIGWALNRGKLELYRHFGAFNDVQDPQVQNLLVWEAHCYQFNLIGDPGTELWTGVPHEFSVNMSDTLMLGEQHLSVQVRDSRDNSPVSNAVVTLLFNDEPIRVVNCDASGNVLFTFEPNELSEGELVLAVSKHNMITSIDTIAVVPASNFIAASSVLVDDDNAGRSRGNGNRIPNPGEMIELRTYLSNFGNEAPDGALDAVLSSNRGDYQIVNGSVHLNASPDAGDSAVVTFLVQIGNSIQNNQRLVFNLTTTVDEVSWLSTISLQTGSFDLEYVRHAFTPNPFRPGDTAWVDVTVRNTGGLTSPQLVGHLESLTAVVSVFNSQAAFSPVSVDAADSLATARFRVYAHSLTVPGTKGEFILTFESEAGLRDTTTFTYSISSPNSDTPFGPDNYGYVCFDNTDERWDVSPDYEWIEIDTALGGTGQNTDIRDRGNEQDWSVLIDLPFTFQYYGEDFRQATICSNGWLSFGDESKLADFQNRRIPPALGPRAQVCVFWDDLVNYMDRNGAQIGGVFYKFDEENHRFIVEWSRMRRYIGMEEDRIRVGSEETFQAIIYDPQHYPTYTGDGEIVFQYRDISNDPDVDPGEFDTPYATVGIVNLNGTDGMEYTYWNAYPLGAAPLADGRAIKFSTKLIVVVGYAKGTVIDAETRQPIPNAEIRGSRGSFTTTDRSGQYVMNNILIGEDYNFTAWAPGYNDSTVSQIDIVEGDTATLNFALLHPTFTISHNEISDAIKPDFGADYDISIQNRGNGFLDYATKLTYPGVAEEGNWPQILNTNATVATGDNRIQSLAYFNGRIWVAGSNNNTNPNKFYRFSADGTYRDFIAQPGSSNFGIRGTTSDGEFLYGGEGAWIYQMNANGGIVDSIPGPLDLQRALAYDSELDAFWVANGRDDQIVRINREGEVTARFDHELDVNGLAFFSDDPDGFPLYLLSRDRTNPGLQVPEALISKLNPETGEIRVVTVLDGGVEDRGGEIEITSQLDSRKWVMIAAMANPAGTRISVYDLGPNTTWLSFSPRSGHLDPQEESAFHLRLDATDLDEGEYELILRFIHNAAGLRTDIPIQLTVDNEAAVGDLNEIPYQFSLSPAFPNPFNSTTLIRYSVADHGLTELALYDLSGRQVQLLESREFQPGNYTTTLSAENLPSGLYLLKLSSGTSHLSMKVALIR